MPFARRGQLRENRCMAGPPGTEALAKRIRTRFTYAMIGSNLAGAVAVLLILWIVLPTPGTVAHPNTALIVNLIVFAVAMPIVFSAATVWSRRLGNAHIGWAAVGREPTERERELTLRYPLTQQLINGTIWAANTVLFTALNATFSGELAVNVAVTTALGGFVTCALGYLLGERVLRPLTALALATEVPPRPQLPGVAARVLLSWTLGTGVLLLGVVLVATGGLYDRRYTAGRVAVAVTVLAGIGMVVGFTMMLGLARSLAERIEGLRQAAGRVEHGDLDQDVTVDDGSELGLLQAGFNQMVAGLREREHLRDLFGRQVGEDVVKHALEHGVELGGEAREAAVRFVDLEGSTALAEERDPAEVVNLLNAFFAIVVEVIAAHQGWVNKFEGDAALCVFGAPLPDPEAASHALAAARELRRRLATELPQVKAGIGVSAGRVVAGNVGAARRFEYTVIGDPVNEAARLSELAKQTEERLLVSEAALSRAGGEDGRWELRDSVRLRGRSAPTKLAVPRD